MTEAPLAELEAHVAATENLPDDSRERIDALVNLGWALRASDQERANDLAASARQLSIACGYKLGQARAARVLGMTRGTLTRSMRDHLAYGEESLKLFDEVGDLAGSAGARDFLATIYEFIGEFSVAMEFAQEAVQFARQAGDPARQGFALANIGSILAMSGDVTAAVAKLQEALSLFESVEHRHGIARISRLLAKVCREHERLPEAWQYARRALEMSTDAGVVADEGAAALSELAALAEHEGDQAAAEDYLRQSLSKYNSDAGRGAVGTADSVKLARMMLAKGQVADAQQELAHALRAVSNLSVELPRETAEVHLALADTHERQGELSAVVEHLREAVRLRQRAAKDETRDKLAQLELRTELKAAQQDAEIHRLKFVELSQMQAKLIEAEKMAQLGTLAAGTAHELNTPLGVLRSNLGVFVQVGQRLGALASTSPNATPTGITKLTATLSTCEQTSSQAIERIAAVTESYKRFTQLDLAQQGKFDVREGLVSALALLRPNVPAHIRIVTELETVPDIDAWPGQLNQAFLTVLQNAVDAIGEAPGELTVRTRVEGDDLVSVRISDNGRGMNDEEREHLFDVGWSAGGARTKMRLGLAAAHATVKRHHGEIRVTSSPGAGSSFDLVFPVSRS